MPYYWVTLYSAYDSFSNFIDCLLNSVNKTAETVVTHLYGTTVSYEILFLFRIIPFVLEHPNNYLPLTGLKYRQALAKSLPLTWINQTLSISERQNPKPGYDSLIASRQVSTTPPLRIRSTMSEWSTCRSFAIY